MTSPTEATPPADHAPSDQPLSGSSPLGDPRKAGYPLRHSDAGAWTWALHRIIGVAIFGFLIVHVLDTALLRVSPDTYNRVVEIYKNPIVAVLEALLALGLLFHALNGIRIIAGDVVMRGRHSEQAPRWLAPNSRVPRSQPGRVETYAWLFVRISGLLLVVLALGHLAVVLLLGDHVQQVNFSFVAGRWANLGWRIWDFALLWLAVLHGGHGLRTVIGDYARNPRTRQALTGLLLLVTLVILALSSYVIVSFDGDLR